MDKRITRLASDPYTVSLADRECSLFIDPQSAQIFMDEGAGEGRVNGAVFTPANGPRFSTRAANGSSGQELILAYCGVEVAVGSTDSSHELDRWAQQANAFLKSKAASEAKRPERAADHLRNGKAPSMSQSAITVQNLTKNYGPVLAVDDISFGVEAGQLVGFLGPNGAGKSTTMRILTTFLPASRGYAWVAGFDVMYQSMEVRKRIGYLPESVPLYPEMRVREYLSYRARLKGVDRGGRSARIDDCMKRCRIKEVQNRLLGTLSKGYRQRVGLAYTLLADPPVLILDEPTSGLDPIQIQQTLETIKDLAGKHTVLLSTHILPEVEKVCERVIIINKGQIKFDNTLQSIAEREPVLQIEVRGPGDDVTRFLHDQPEVASVAAKPSAPELTAFDIRTRDRKDQRELLASRVLSKGWSIRRLDLKRASLEEVYTAVVMPKAESAVQAAPESIPAA